MKMQKSLLLFIRLIAFAFMTNNIYVSSLISPNKWNSDNNHNIVLIHDHSRSSISHHNNRQRYHKLDSSTNNDDNDNTNEINKIKLNDNNGQLYDNKNNVIMINGETDMKKVRRFNYKVNALM